jgi:hypothetical protein
MMIHAVLFLLWVGLADFHGAALCPRLLRTWHNRAERRQLERERGQQWRWTL